MLDSGAMELVAFGAAVQQLISLSVHAGARRTFLGGLCAKVAARSDRAPVLVAAEHLAAVLPTAKVVGVTTGFINPPTNTCGETDGPPGAIVLARGLVERYGIEVMLLAEPATWDVLGAAARAAGLPVAVVDRPTGVAQLSIVSRQLAFDTPPESIDQLLGDWRPSALVAIEKLGRNEHGRYHSAAGVDLSRHSIAADRVTDELGRRGGLTIGIGDLGNEIGLGPFADLAQEAVPSLLRCSCDCGGPVTTITTTTCAVMGACSNWGTYGMLACLGVILGDRRMLHDAELERRMIEACLAAGAVDASGLGRAVDGATLSANQSVVQLLGELFDNASPR